MLLSLCHRYRSRYRLIAQQNIEIYYKRKLHTVRLPISYPFSSSRFQLYFTLSRTYSPSPINYFKLSPTYAPSLIDYADSSIC